jgi:5-methylthioadenosine/S-adenosylhomocysteine deaminase
VSGWKGGLTVTDARLDGESVGLRCEEGTIVALGPQAIAEPGDERIDAGGAQLVPALVNGHTHAAMTLFRGYGGDLPLMRWLEEKIWPVEARLEAEDVYWGTRLACLEMIRTGTARFWDMYWHPEATSRAVRDAGLRATVGGPLFGHGEDMAEIEASALANLDAQEDFRRDGIEPGLAPHSIYIAGEKLLRWTAAVAEQRGLSVQIHLSETEKEVEDCLAMHDARPAHYLDRLGLLGERTVLSHGVWLDRSELELIAERGCTVVTNPVANMKLAVGGVFPYPAAREAGVAVGLGTDGAGSKPPGTRRRSAPARPGGSPSARPPRCWAVGRWLRAVRPTSSSCGAAPTRRAWVSWPPISSMRRPARSSTQPSSAGAF